VRYIWGGFRGISNVGQRDFEDLFERLHHALRINASVSVRADGVGPYPELDFGALSALVCLTAYCVAQRIARHRSGIVGCKIKLAPSTLYCSYEMSHDGTGLSARVENAEAWLKFVARSLGGELQFNDSQKLERISWRIPVRRYPDNE